MPGTASEILRAQAAQLLVLADQLDGFGNPPSPSCLSTATPPLDAVDGALLLALKRAARHVDTGDLAERADCGIRTCRRRVPDLIAAGLVKRTKGKIGVMLTNEGAAALATIRHSLP